MGKPSVYVFDCSQAGNVYLIIVMYQLFFLGQVIESFKLFTRERECEFLLEVLNYNIMMCLLIH